MHTRNKHYLLLTKKRKKRKLLKCLFFDYLNIFKMLLFRSLFISELRVLLNSFPLALSQSI